MTMTTLTAAAGPESLSGVLDLACYQGVPNEVVAQCESMWQMSKAVRLEALRRIRDALAPYGQFKQWCADHDESYPAVAAALTRAYGAVTKPAMCGSHIERSLPKPPPALQAGRDGTLRRPPGDWTEEQLDASSRDIVTNNLSAGLLTLIGTDPAPEIAAGVAKFFDMQVYGLTIEQIEKASEVLQALIPLLRQREQEPQP